MKRLIASVAVVAVVCASISTANVGAKPSTSTIDCPGSSVLLFPPWYSGLKCDVTTDKDSKGENVITAQAVKIDNINQVWVIVMNIVQWLIIAGGYVSLYFVIWGGFKYITSEGDPQKVASAKGAITNAVIGLIIVLASVAIIRTIQAAIGGSLV